MICWMFPGQPIAFAGAPSDEIEFREITRICQESTGCNPLESDTSASNLSQNVRLQLLGTCISLYRSNQVARQGDGPDLITEHSMGIYPALAASGSINSATALELTYRIGVAMVKMGIQREYALGCVIGMTCAPLEKIAANNSVHIANYNTSRHFLLAGERKNIDAALVEARASGAFSATVFSCDAPLHTPLIAEIAADIRQIVAEYSFRDPQIPLVEHISQTALTAATIPAFLVDELCRPVYWDTTYRTLRFRGVTRFQEVGAGRALSKFNRWIDSET